jgi:hypothetical protein
MILAQALPWLENEPMRNQTARWSANPPGTARRAPLSLSEPSIRETLTRVARKYPKDQIPRQLEDVERVTYNIRLATSRTRAPAHQIRIADIGGGLGLFSVGCAALGMRVDLVDDFGDPINDQFNGVLPVHAEYEVRFFRRDAVTQGFHAPNEQFDIVTSFDSIEHWGKWSTFSEWYDPDRFRGHVREPDVEDLRTIARDMGLIDVEIHGRNWLGYHSRYPLVPQLTPLIDRALRPFPSLCADIYVIGTKPA